MTDGLLTPSGARRLVCASLLALLRQAQAQAARRAVAARQARDDGAPADSGGARWSEAEPRGRAAEHQRQGLAANADGDFGEAARCFEASFLAWPRASSATRMRETEPGLSVSKIWIPSTWSGSRRPSRTHSVLLPARGEAAQHLGLAPAFGKTLGAPSSCLAALSPTPN